MRTLFTIAILLGLAASAAAQTADRLYSSVRPAAQIAIRIPEAAVMRQNSFGELRPVSALTLGGGGIGMVWGETTFDECVATVHEAVAAGINLIDLAPSYGDGKAEQVVGEAFGGHLPDGVQVTSKCGLSNPPVEEIEPRLRQSIEGSLGRLRLSRLDLFFFHSNVVPDKEHVAPV